MAVADAGRLKAIRPTNAIRRAAERTAELTDRILPLSAGNLVTASAGFGIGDCDGLTRGLTLVSLPARLSGDERGSLLAKFPMASSHVASYKVAPLRDATPNHH